MGEHGTRARSTKDRRPAPARPDKSLFLTDRSGLRLPPSVRLADARPSCNVPARRRRCGAWMRATCRKAPLIVQRAPLDSCGRPEPRPYTHTPLTPREQTCKLRHRTAERSSDAVSHRSMLPCPPWACKEPWSWAPLRSSWCQNVRESTCIVEGDCEWWHQTQCFWAIGR